jgi:hypothetical protein
MHVLLPLTRDFTAEFRNVSPNATEPRVFPGCSMLGMSYKYRHVYGNNVTLTNRNNKCIIIIY